MPAQSGSAFSITGTFGRLSGPHVRGQPKESRKGAVESDVAKLNSTNDRSASLSDTLAWRQLIENVRT